MNPASLFELPDHLPPVLTREQLLFSWALGEAYSPRWRDMILTQTSGSLKDKLERAETRDFTGGEQAALITAWTPHRENYILEYIDKSSRFRIARLPAHMLGRVAVLPSFSHEAEPVMLNRYIKMESKEEWKHDPRQAAKKLWQNPPKAPYRSLPIIAYSDKLQNDVLIDGYCRCITALWHLQQGKTLPAVIPFLYCERG